MIYVDIDPIQWSKKYNLKIKSIPCYKCGKKVEVNIPYITRTTVGFEGLDHGCGKGYKLKSFLIKKST